MIFSVLIAVGGGETDTCQKSVYKKAVFIFGFERIEAFAHNFYFHSDCGQALFAFQLESCVLAEFYLIFEKDFFKGKLDSQSLALFHSDRCQKSANILTGKVNITV